MALPPRIWFQLQRLRRVFGSAWGPKGQSYDTSHRMCPHCRALIERSASVCQFCGGKLRGARARGSSGAPERVLGVIPIPTTASSVVIGATVLFYGLSWYLTAQSGAPSGMGDISGDVLFRLGAKSGWAIRLAHQWWRLVTAMFLHAGLFHIGMNLWCLFDLAPEVESIFSTPKFIVFYLITGAFGFLASTWWSLGLSVGASGAIMGLIGILIGASFHHGSMGQAYRGMLWRWVIYILALGLVFPFLGFGLIDNAAHIGGLISGLVLGYFVPQGEEETRAGEILWNVLAVFAVIIIAGSFALMALQLNTRLQ